MVCIVLSKMILFGETLTIAACKSCSAGASLMIEAGTGGAAIVTVYSFTSSYGSFSVPL